jgi:hypothetical protein
MQEKCSFLFVHVEIAAIFADFSSVGRSNGTEDEMYFVVRGRDLAASADALIAITRANRALQQYAEGRRGELASA